MKLRIVRKYRRNSEWNSIIDTAIVEFGSKEDGMKFVSAVNANPKQKYDIIDYSWLLIGGAEEIIENPTDGYVGPMEHGKPRRN